MRLAIMGATSQIAKDLICSLAMQGSHELLLYARRPDAVKRWLADVKLDGRFPVQDFSAFGSGEPAGAVLNFVGVGDPAQAAAMGASIFDITLKYDGMALAYIQEHPGCRYLFLSSGAAYGASYSKPADADTVATVAINNLTPQDWYAVAKLHAESRHRAATQLPIVDLRVFNYFSRTQDISARFLITDILRAIRQKAVLKTSEDLIVRDYLNPVDFSQLVSAILAAPPANAVVDCYSKEPIAKSDLLKAMQENLGLQYEVVASAVTINATGVKPHYYSLNKRAEAFGYEPTLTSLEGVLLEARALLDSLPVGPRL
jgi:nucleoside-diphosphate-sugar epimerase